MRQEREHVYEVEVRPLVDEIVAICQEHGIRMRATFHADDRPREPGSLAYFRETRTVEGGSLTSARSEFYILENGL